MTKKTALITGGTKGIGKAIASVLAQNDYNIVLNYRSNEEVANKTKEELTSFGAEVKLAKGDVSKLDDCKNIIDLGIETFGKIDVLVNNAGINRDNLIVRMSEEDFDDVINSNLKSAFLMMKLVSRHMSKNRYGKIINISSVVGIAGNAGQVNYAASKAGIIGMTKSLAKELGSRNVLVNAIAPGFIKSDMTEKLDKKTIDKYKQSISLNRLGEAEDVANLVKFLASDESNYITGQVISVDGGMSF